MMIAPVSSASGRSIASRNVIAGKPRRLDSSAIVPESDSTHAAFSWSFTSCSVSRTFAVYGLAGLGPRSTSAQRMWLLAKLESTVMLVSPRSPASCSFPAKLYTSSGVAIAFALRHAARVAPRPRAQARGGPVRRPVVDRDQLPVGHGLRDDAGHGLVQRGRGVAHRHEHGNRRDLHRRSRAIAWDAASSTLSPPSRPKKPIVFSYCAICLHSPTRAGACR